jgi:hypothetical protein
MKKITMLAFVNCPKPCQTMIVQLTIVQRQQKAFCDQKGELENYLDARLKKFQCFAK